ncbi:hypothetical protein [Hugenholtzia roseola]|uniref:hypothetical protein n=1 Tax=Hugenholtzia roseola TaxID=1002 RepID=UPI000411B05A|nr:hypothetical protein [Hugenholtzia roseola]
MKINTFACLPKVQNRAQFSNFYPKTSRDKLSYLLSSPATNGISAILFVTLQPQTHLFTQ